LDDEKHSQWCLCLCDSNQYNAAFALPLTLYYKKIESRVKNIAKAEDVDPGKVMWCEESGEEVVKEGWKGKSGSVYV